ncbi:hypothetical protein ACOME3_010088 [Neoechinorhynchus agilis]
MTIVMQDNSEPLQRCCIYQFCNLSTPISSVELTKADEKTIYAKVLLDGETYEGPITLYTDSETQSTSSLTMELTSSTPTRRSTRATQGQKRKLATSAPITPKKVAGPVCKRLKSFVLPQPSAIDTLNVGVLVWAKLKYIPWWPAKIMAKVSETSFQVLWLGDGTTSLVPYEHLRLFDEYTSSVFFKSKIISK